MRILFLLFCAVIAFSCSRPDLDSAKKTQLLPFTVTVVERMPNTAVIQWTAGTNEPGAVRYRVTLDNRLVSTDLTRQTDTIRNLSAGLAYSGTVCVYTQTGDSAFAFFTLNKLSTAPRPLRPFTVTVLERSPTKAIIEWTESVNLYDSEVVKYDVLLQGQVVHSSLVGRKDTLQNLHMDSLYTGRIRAHTIAGDTASAPFQLEKLNGFVYFGAGGNGMQCYNLFSRMPVWQSSGLGTEFYDMPAIADSTVYVNAQVMGGAELHAFNARTGQTVWKRQLTNNNSPYNNISPVYRNGVVYTVTLNGVHAINAASGQVLWSYTPAEREFTFNPVVDGNLLFVTLNETDLPPGIPLRRKMIALSINTGQPVWEKIVEYVPSKNPVIYGGLLIYGASDGRIYALNQSDGTVNWSRNFSVAYNNLGANTVSPVIYNNTVIVHNANQGYFALSAQTGATVWNYPDVTQTSSPTIGNGVLYFATHAPNKIVAVNLSNGAQVWETSLNGYTASPIFVKNRIYLTTYDGFLVYNALNGEFIHQFTTATGVNFHGTPAIVSEGSVYYAAESGMLH